MRPAAQMHLPLDRAEPPPAPPAVARVPRPEPVGTIDGRVRPAAEAVAALAGDWAELAAEASEPNSFAEHWFVSASLASIGAGGRIRLFEARRGGRLVGVMLLAVESGYGRSPVRFVTNWSHHHMFLGTPLVRRGEEIDFWATLLDTLDAAGWAPGFLHVTGLVEEGPVLAGLSAAAAARGRQCPIVYRERRALLASELDSRTYYERTVRPKKRKEIRRLRTRLAEQGELSARRLDDGTWLREWCDAFLALERSGWKGEAGTALACAPETETFFRDALAGAWNAGRLHFLRLDLDGRPIAMLVDFLAAPGSFSFKTCFDEAFARFSPGVLVQLENLGILDCPDIAWMDSCAVENHPMIDSLWTERRSVVRATVRLSGAHRSATYFACRALESGSAALRRLFGGRGK